VTFPFLRAGRFSTKKYSRKEMALIVLNEHRHFNGHIRTSKLTEPAAEAIFEPHGNGFPLIIELQNALRTESHAYAASLAPLTVDQ
jgi:hypothetical protein